MFKKSRNKIVVVIMSVLVFLWVGTLGIIYFTTYFSVSERNFSMLESHANGQLITYSMDKEEPPGKREPMNNHHPFDNNPTFMLSTFYTVVFDHNGYIIETINAQPALHSNEELQKYATDILLANEIKGKNETLLYCSVSNQTHTLVAFMDNTIFQESLSELFKYTLIYGGLAILVFFFLSFYFANKIVKPLEESYEKQKRFISDASHELKTPISVINANVEILSREIGPNKWISNIQYENSHMGDLVGQLLELARTESVIPHMEPLDFSHLIQGETLPFETMAFEKGLTLNLDLCSPAKIKGEKTKLCRLVSTLVENAISYGKEGTQIDIQLKKDYKNVYFTVTNEGDAIPPEHLPNIFDRFYRVDSARNEKGHYGLGLAIAKAIVTSHKGTIEALCFDGKIQFVVKFPIYH